MLEGRSEVGYPVGDVMKTGSATSEETCDRTGIGSRFDEFQGSDEGDVDVLFGQFFDVGTSGPGNGFVNRRGLLDGRNRDADVVERKTVHMAVPWKTCVESESTKLGRIVGPAR